MKTKFVSLLVAASAFVATSARADIVVVVNPASPVASMTTAQVSDLFLGTTASLPNGNTPKLIDQKSAIRDEFYEKLTGRKAQQVKAIWARIVFTGKALPPTELTNAAEVKKFIGQNPDAVGYIAASEVDDSVKAVLKIN